MKRHSPPDIQELTSSLDYDPLTGKFTWKKQRASNCVIGKEAGYITGYGYSVHNENELRAATVDEPRVYKKLA